MGEESTARTHQIECYNCGDPISGWCVTSRYGFWDEDAQNYVNRPFEKRHCDECWNNNQGRPDGAHFRPESAQHLWDVLDAANGGLAGVLCWWTGRPSVRIVNGEPEAAVTKPRPDGYNEDGTPILRFEPKEIEDFDRERFFQDAEPPENEDMNLVRLLRPERTSFVGLDGDLDG